MEGNQADLEKQNEAKARGFVSGLIRKYLVSLIADILLELWRKSRRDPAFTQGLTDAFSKLDAASTQEEDHAAAKALQDVICS